MNLYINWNKGRKLWSVFRNPYEPPIFMVKGIFIEHSSSTLIVDDKAFIIIEVESLTTKLTQKKRPTFIFWNTKIDEEILIYDPLKSDETQLFIYK